MIIWLIGVSGAGKTTVGRMLCERMRATGKHVLLLDGDRLRDVWNDDLGHEMSARRRNHTRISKLCALLDQDPSIDLVVPALSIFPDLRAWNRQHFSRYVEVFLDLPMEEAIRRDRKGIYARALGGEMRDVVGVDIPFPPPIAPDLVIGSPDIFGPPEKIAARIHQHLTSPG